MTKSREIRDSYRPANFESLVDDLSGMLGVTQEEVVHAFDHANITIRHSRTGGGRISIRHFFHHEAWEIVEQDDEGYYIIMKEFGDMYRVGFASYSELDRETGMMVEKTYVIVTEMPTRYFGGTDSDESL